MLPNARLTAPALLVPALLFGCSGISDGVNCASVNAPAELHLTNVAPALGSSVPNDAVVHTFSVQDNVAFEDIALAYLPAHTAGDPDPALTFNYKVSADTVDYTATDPVTWQTAPGHVEIEAPVIYQTPDGCAYQLPTPLFSYDVTAP
jgi:hypothetical protein